MKVIYTNKNGKIIHGDNLEVLAELNKSSVDSFKELTNENCNN